MFECQYLNECQISARWNSSGRSSNGHCRWIGTIIPSPNIQNKNVTKNKRKFEIFLADHQTRQLQNIFFADVHKQGQDSPTSKLYSLSLWLGLSQWKTMLVEKTVIVELGESRSRNIFNFLCVSAQIYAEFCTNSKRMPLDAEFFTKQNCCLGANHNLSNTNFNKIWPPSFPSTPPPYTYLCYIICEQPHVLNPNLFS